MLGGKDNFEADRLAAAEAIEIFPKTVQSAQSCRTYLSRIPPGSYLAIGHHTADIYPEPRRGGAVGRGGKEAVNSPD